LTKRELQELLPKKPQPWADRPLYSAEAVLAAPRKGASAGAVLLRPVALTRWQRAWDAAVFLLLAALVAWLAWTWG
jgi:hypothetical protein